MFVLRRGGITKVFAREVQESMRMRLEGNTYRCIGGRDVSAQKNESEKASKQGKAGTNGEMRWADEGGRI